MCPPITIGDSLDETVDQGRRYISSERVTYEFDASAVPIEWVSSPACLTIHARDAYDGHADDLDVSAYARRRIPGRMNPCTGPIGILDAAPGDVLQVTIDAIRVAPRGYVAATRGTGILGNCEVDPGIEPFDVEGNLVQFANRITLPVRPMVGTIGVAPASGSIATLSLGDHGGNLDFNEIAAGTTVHLPIRAPGALFGIGDVHVTMGDGEAHSGVNIAAEIDITISVNRRLDLSWPWFETATHVMTLGVAEDLSEAARQATAAMEQRLRCDLRVTPTHARMLAGAAVDLRLGQAGGYGVPVSVYARFPKSSIEQADSSL